MENRVVRLARGEYELEGDHYNAAHNSISATPYRAPVWREGFGPLQIASGVLLIGEEDVVLSGDRARLVVQTEGVCFDSLHLSRAVTIERGGSATMMKCTSGQVGVVEGASLVMEDSRVIGSDGYGASCNDGELKVTRCTVEGSRYDCIYAADATVELYHQQ